MQDNYGTFINKYTAYTDTPGGMEYELGRKPAIRALGPIQGDLILDLGCGPAVNGPELNALGADVIGIDVNEGELAVARQRDPRSTYLHYDGIHLADAINDHYRGRRLSGTIATFSAVTMPKGMLEPILRDIHQLSTWGSKLILAEPNLQEAMGMKYHDLHYHAQPGVKSGDHVKVTLGVGETAHTLEHDIYRTHSDNFRLIEKAGFTITDFYRPRPRGWNALRWWKATLVPPFAIYVARKR